MTYELLPVGVHVFARIHGEPPAPSECEVCGGRWETLDDALDAECVRKGAA
ncbi:MAG TPA: hypothetical protein VEA38_00815 [Terriglobales bacterium]|nr:hypothetical protein [Terriglobales bacterium]